MTTIAKDKIIANDVADWFLCHIDREAGDSLTHLKLQKLVYYSQAWHLALFNKPIFVEEIQAWSHGPVIPSVFRRYRGKGFEAIDAPQKCKTFDNKTEQLLKEINSIYGRLTAKDLERLTHSEAPWIIARNGLPVEVASTNVISHDSMREHYKTVLNNAKKQS